jgi:hypothetical protein
MIAIEKISKTTVNGLPVYKHNRDIISEEEYNDLLAANDAAKIENDREQAEALAEKQRIEAENVANGLNPDGTPIVEDANIKRHYRWEDVPRGSGADAIVDFLKKTDMDRVTAKLLAPNKARGNSDVQWTAAVSVPYTAAFDPASDNCPKGVERDGVVFAKSTRIWFTPLNISAVLNAQGRTQVANMVLAQPKLLLTLMSGKPTISFFVEQLKAGDLYTNPFSATPGTVVAERACTRTHIYDVQFDAQVMDAIAKRLSLATIDDAVTKVMDDYDPFAPKGAKADIFGTVD